MNEITIMENPRFGRVRKVLVDGEWFFVAKDVAAALGYKNTKKALSDHCGYGVTKRYPIVDNMGRHQEARIIPKPDVLRLIAQSRLPAAQEFNRWLFEEVAPAAVENGMYLSPERAQQLFTDPASIIAICQNWQRDREQLALAQQKIEQDAPKVLFADGVSKSDTDINVGDLAKILKQQGMDIGRDRLFKKLREDGYLISQQGRSRNMPSQKSMNLGLMRVKETAITHSDGKVVVHPTTLITGKGQLYFVNRYIKN